jgi:predicted acyl esterase
VGLSGVSYFATKQWQVAALQPRHLAAIIPWEGCCDFYREWSRHGGIRAQFPVEWWPRQILPDQHGNGEMMLRDAESGENTNGAPLSSEMLEGNRAAFPDEILKHVLDDQWYRERAPDFSRITVPILSAANWGGPGLHLRGNIEGFLAAASADKWLSAHIGTHFESFYLPEYVAMQKRFFDRYLKGIENGWEDEPKVQIAVRGTAGTHRRMEHEWPLARTIWQKWYLDAAGMSLDAVPLADVHSVGYRALGDGLDFSTQPFAAETEITGPVMARLFVSSSTTDLDLFATLRLLDPAGDEVVFTGAHEPTPVTRGWLRASHRKLDPERSLPYRPYHSHDEVQKMEPGEIVALDVEIWPTSIVCPPCYRLVLTLQGRDFEYDTGGRMLHNDPRDRPEDEFGGLNTLHAGAMYPSYLLLPHIPDLVSSI